MTTDREQILEAASVAAGVARRFHIREQVTESNSTRVDSFAVAAQAEVCVIRKPMQHLLGAYLRNPESPPGIIINSERPTGLINLTCAHELGHHFLDHPTTQDFDMFDHGEIREKAADMFAYRLMAPKWLIDWNIRQLQLTRAKIAEPFWQYQLSLRLGLSYRATRITLRRVNYLTPRAFRESDGIEPREIKLSIIGPQIDFDLRNDVWFATEADQAVVLAPAPNDLIVLGPGSAVGSGYVWTVPQAEEHGFSVEQVGNRDEPIGDHPLIGGESILKAAARYTQEGELRDHPQQVIRFEEVRPWSRGTPARALDFSLRYSERTEGLDYFARQAMIEASDDG